MSDIKTMSDFNLPQPPAAVPRENRLLYQERPGYDMRKLAATLWRVPNLNEDQRSVFDTVTTSLEAHHAGTMIQVCLMHKPTQGIVTHFALNPCCCGFGDMYTCLLFCVAYGQSCVFAWSTASVICA